MALTLHNFSELGALFSLKQLSEFDRQKEAEKNFEKENFKKSLTSCANQMLGRLRSKEIQIYDIKILSVWEIQCLANCFCKRRL